MLDEYIEIEDIKEEEAKVIPNVRFRADYDITDVLTLWGNWARKGAYLKQNTPNLYQSQKIEYKECCNDDDGLIINRIIRAMKNTKTCKTKDEVTVLLKYYYGDEILDVDHIFVERSKIKESCSIIIIPRTLQEIADYLGCSEATVRKIKSSGESHIIGALSMLTMHTGKKLELLQNMRY